MAIGGVDAAIVGDLEPLPTAALGDRNPSGFGFGAGRPFGVVGLLSSAVAFHCCASLVALTLGFVATSAGFGATYPDAG